MTLPEGFKFNAHKIGHSFSDLEDSWKATATKWRVTLTNPRGEKFTTRFYMGSGHNGQKPEALEVINSLLLDIHAAEDYPDFREFCANMGYDPHKEYKKAYKIYTECCDLRDRLTQFFTPEEFETFHELTEDY